MRLALIDSSPLINLTHLGLCDKLALFFDRIYAPRAVHREVNRKARFRHKLQKLYRTGFFIRCDAADATNVRLLSHELGDGEAEALIQAQEMQAAFFLGDDKRAREIGRNLGLRCVGTARILARLQNDCYAGEARALIAKLQRDLGFRVSEAVIAEALATASEPI